MTTFKQWLDATPGMTKEIGRQLGVGKTIVSNVRCGRQSVPVRWIPDLIRLSKNTLTHKSLVEEILAYKARKHTP